MADSEISLNVKLQGSKEFSKELDTVNKMAEFTEKDQYRLEMTTKNRLELIKVIRELEASLRGAIQNQDADAIKATEEKLAVAKQQFEKLNQEQAMLQIQFAQQMQAGQQLAQSFDALASGLGNFSESVKNGTVNLAGMANSIIQVGLAVKAGLGPIAWIVAALQLLQGAFNSYAQTQKKIQEIEKENKAILEAEKDLYNDLKQARAEYDAQVTQSKSLAALKTEYTAIKDRLSESLKLIEKSTRAELVRLSLIKDEEEFAQLQERYELGRSFKRGDISEAEYRKRIVELDKKKATAEAEREAAKAQAELAGKKAAAEKKAGVAETSLQTWAAANQALRGFKVSDAEIGAYTGKINQQKSVADEYSKKLADWLIEEIGMDFETAKKAASSKDVLKAIENYNPEIYRYLMLNDAAAPGTELNALISGRNTAFASLNKISEQLKSLLGGLTPEEYQNARTLAQQEEETRRNEYNAANEAARAAWQDYYNAPSARAIDITRGKAVRAAEFEAEQRLADIANDEAIAAADAKRAAEIAAARDALTSMTGGDLKQALRTLAPGLASTNTKDKAHAEALAEIYTAEQARRSSERTTYKKQYLSDKKFDAREIDAVFEMYDKGIEENNKALQALAKYLLKNGQKYAETTADLKRIKNKLSDMQ
jgi:hypothetical protein